MTATPFNTGWSYRQPLGPFAAVQDVPAPPTPVTLPHDALRDADRSPDVPGKGAGAYYPPGAYTYLKTFDAPTEWADRAVRLEFQGAFRHAMVFVNDEFAGNRADGYARFFVDIKPYLRLGGSNEVRVEVRSGQDSRWYSGCGIHRPVVLHVDDPVHIVPDGVRVTTLDVEPEQAVVEVATRVVNRTLATTTATLTTTVTDPSGRPVEGDETPVTLAPGETALVRHRAYLPDPQRWSVDTPHLYAATSALVAPAGTGPDWRSEARTTFGVRTIQVDPHRGLRINGEPVLLRGACIHHDNGPLGAAAIGRAEERRVELLKAAGFNAIRATHNPLSVTMLEACDRMGMLVMDEAFDMWTRGKTAHDYAQDFPQWWDADLESMVTKDYNHPSVILYSLGNEIVETGTPHGARLARRMAEHIRSLDPTRLVTNGVNAALAVLDEVPEMLEEAGAGLNEVLADVGDSMNALGATYSVTTRTAESSSVLDVLGLNYADARYAMDRELFPHRVIVGSETFPTRIGTLWPLVRDHPHVIGDFTWTGWDYLGEVGIGATAYAEDESAVAALEREFPYLTAWCGDIDTTGWRRPVSYYREIVFGLRTEPYVAVRRPERFGHTVTLQSPWAWSDSVSSWTWPGHEDRPVTVEVYADADEVALLRDGQEVARGPVGEPLPMLAVLETTYVPGELVAVAYRGGAEMGRTSLNTAGEPELAVSADRTRLHRGDHDLAFVAVEVRDAAGVLVTTADRPVTVEVAGAGQLVGMCSGNPKTSERFDADTWCTFDGRVLAVVRPTGDGPITVRVRAEGLEPRTLTLEVGGAETLDT
jgi:beta-galactosidase